MQNITDLKLGIIGTNFAAVNIGLFIIAVILGAYVAYRILISEENYNLEIISIILIVAFFIIFILYTIDPPKIQYFKDPEDGTYGINRDLLLWFWLNNAKINSEMK